MAKRRTTPLRITESLDGQRTVDVEKGIVADVKFLGLRSRKGYDYSPDGLKNAVQLYDGIKVYEDHPDPKNPKRSVSEVIGVAVNPRFVEGDGIRGDIKVFRNTEGGQRLLEAAQDPDKSKALGFSHNADPTTISKDKRTGRQLVNGIAKVYSLDLVDNPATTNGIHESMDMETITIREVFASAFPVGPAVKMLEDMGMPMDTPMAAPAAETGHEEQVKDAFLAAVTAVWKDDALDAKAKLAKIKDIASAQEKLLSSGEPEPAPAEEGAAKEGEEGPEKEKSEGEMEKKKEEGQPIGFGKVLELGKKYKVDDAAILEEAANLPAPRAIRLLESVGRRRLAEDETTTSSSARQRATFTVEEDHSKWLGSLKESIASEDRARLMESLS